MSTGAPPQRGDRPAQQFSGRLLEPGQGVAVVAPAGGVEAEAYAAGLGILAARYRIVLAYDPLGAAGTHREPSSALPYLSANDDTRTQAIHAALRHPEVTAVFCARGGYGCMRLLERLDDTALRSRGLPIVGFSDVTALHAWAARLGVRSIHGPVVTQLPRLPRPQLDALFALLEGRVADLTLRGLRGLRPGRARGPLFAGNLAVLAHLCGTPYFPPLAGRILLLEEVDEAPYRVDRLLTQLLLAGELQRAAGIVVGQLVGCDATRGSTWSRSEPLRGAAVAAERLAALEVPVAFGAAVGHGNENVALPQGAWSELDTVGGTLKITV
ncbi:MAG: LD-carboxypeptidase [Proteobacteria bacterium]|nr:LD-carboxypeptidase [Pseudomonadota bacterium]